MKNVVLVVDDSELIRNLMTKALEDTYEVVCCKNGREALNEISKDKDRMICMLLDLNMPVYDGFTVLEYFKSYNMFKKIPVFIISGDDTRDTIDRAFTYDIVDMLNKPFSKDKIRDFVSRASSLSNEK